MLISSVNPTAIGWPVRVYKTQTTEPKEAADQVFLGVCLIRIFNWAVRLLFTFLGLCFIFKYKALSFLKTPNHLMNDGRKRISVDSCGLLVEIHVERDWRNVRQLPDKGSRKEVGFLFWQQPVLAEMHINKQWNTAANEATVYLANECSLCNLHNLHHSLCWWIWRNPWIYKVLWQCTEEIFQHFCVIPNMPFQINNYS